MSDTGGVLYAAFTGTSGAGHDPQRHAGLTIHSLIYRVSEATAAEIERVEKEIEEIKAKLPTLAPAVRLFEEIGSRASRSASTTSTSPASSSTSSRSSATRR